MSPQIVVAGAIIVESAVLIAQRRRPPELAGLWELPGGKVMPGESEPAALARELAEELGLDLDAITVGERLGADVVLNPAVQRGSTQESRSWDRRMDPAVTLRAYRVELARGEPRADDHQALRWATAAELPNIAWVPADRAWIADLTRALW